MGAAALPSADVVAEGRLLLIVANKLDGLPPAQRQQALALVRQTVEDSLQDVRCAVGQRREAGLARRSPPSSSSCCRRCLHASTVPRCLPTLVHCSYLPARSGVPILGMSALTGKGADKLLPAALEMYERWNRRVPTSRLNRWLAKVGGVGEHVLRGDVAGRWALRATAQR